PKIPREDKPNSNPIATKAETTLIPSNHRVLRLKRMAMFNNSLHSLSIAIGSKNSV
ncbi:hypothetical protein D046_1960C, partial [Vibrio parahaemolyticus V-223/04]